MCAIAGAINLETMPNTIERMRATMLRRGPDGWGVMKKSNATLLHTRLAIIDPDRGKQPMELQWGAENYTLVYNGELYNTEDLRNRLKKIGHHFLGHSDTEVVLHSYAEWGKESLALFNGIFAFGVWEHNRNRLFLARDRIGVKPLFYMQHGNGLLFASEIKTILCYPTVKAELDWEGAAQIMLLGPGRMPGSGVFRGVEELEPGWCGYYENKKLYKWQYWKLRDGEHTESFEETAEIVRTLVMDAVKRQMISDVPIGTFLSGGLDSSIISALCAKEMEQAGKKLQTFSVDYENNERFFQSGKFQPDSDNAYIDIMLDTISSSHKWTVLTPDDLSDALEDATVARDLPGMADIDFSLLAFCRDIRTEVKTALSGECADEIFGGYPWYRDSDIRSKAGFPWAQTTSERLSLLSDNLRNEVNGTEYVMDAYRKTCLESDILPNASALERRMKEMVNLNFRWFMQTLLDRKDRMSMYTGLEVRVPFCDYRIAEYLYRVPWEFKEYNGREKGLLRYAMKGVLPEKILNRKKSPYPKTFDPRYERLMEDRLQRIISTPGSPLFYLLNRNELIHFLSSKMEWPWYGQLMRRPQTMAFFVSLDFWLKHYSIDFKF